MGFLDSFINKKQPQEQADAKLPAMEKCLAEAFGIVGKSHIDALLDRKTTVSSIAMMTGNRLAYDNAMADKYADAWFSKLFCLPGVRKSPFLLPFRGICPNMLERARAPSAAERLQRKAYNLGTSSPYYTGA